MRKLPLSLIVLAAGCAAPSQQLPPATPPPEPAAAAGLPFEAWEIVASNLEVRVYRDGPMQQLGHNHLISSAALTGVVELRDPRTASGFRH